MGFAGGVCSALRREANPFLERGVVLRKVVLVDELFEPLEFALDEDRPMND